MSRFTPIRTLAELSTLDEREVLDGYREGLDGGPCGDNRSRAYWHGWRNGMVDSGRAEKDAAMAALARETVAVLREQSRSRLQ